MKFLENRWLRGIISFFTGAVVPEWIYMSAGDPNRPRESTMGLTSLLLVVAVYLGLTALVKKNRKSL